MKKFKITKRIVLDYETTGLFPYDGSRAFVAGLENTNGQVLISYVNDKNWKIVKEVIENPNIEKICHGAKFEIKHSKHLGLNPAGKFHDTMALAVLINEYQPINLNGLAIKHFKDSSKDMAQNWLKQNKRIFKKEYEREPNYSDIPKELLEKYLEGDLDKTLKLFIMWFEYVNKNFKNLYDMEIALAWDIVRMEDKGVCIDLNYCRKEIVILKKEQLKMEKEIYKKAEVKFNLASPKQLGEILQLLGIDTGEKNKNGLPKTNYELLESCIDKYPFLKALIDWRTLKKMINTYLIPFTQQTFGNILHPSFWQYGKNKAIVTGRFSSTNPNMQNIPNKFRPKTSLSVLGDLVRKAVIPKKGKAFVFFDYKQIEMFLFTCFSKDFETIELIKNGEDLYIAQAKRIFGKELMNSLKGEDFKKKRYIAKEISLSLIYGMGLRRFAIRIGQTEKEAKKLRDSYFREMPKVREYMLSTQSKLLSQGYVTDIFGRRYHVPNDLAYKSINALCQGSAATIMKKAIINSRALKKYNAYPIMTIHDELVIECPIENINIVAREGKKLFELTDILPIPLKVDIEVSTKNWDDKKPYEIKIKKKKIKSKRIRLQKRY